MDVVVGKRVVIAANLTLVTFSWSRPSSQSAAVRDTRTVIISTEQAAGRRNKESRPLPGKTSFHSVNTDKYRLLGGSFCFTLNTFSWLLTATLCLRHDWFCFFFGEERGNLASWELCRVAFLSETLLALVFGKVTCGKLFFFLLLRKWRTQLCCVAY